MDHPTPPYTLKPSDDWFPFASRAHFRFAEFTYKKTKISKANTNELIKIWEDLAGQYSGECPFQNVQDILSIIDMIDLGHVPWETFSLEYPGELPDFNPPSWMTKEYHIWFHDPHKIIHTILTNKDFDGEIDYSPHQIFIDGKQKYSNLMSGDWAWRQAVGGKYQFCWSLLITWQDMIAEDPSTYGCMFVPTVAGSDGTVVSVATGQNEYHPVYLSVGNVHNQT